MSGKTTTTNTSTARMSGKTTTTETTTTTSTTITKATLTKPEQQQIQQHRGYQQQQNGLAHTDQVCDYQDSFDAKSIKDISTLKPNNKHDLNCQVKRKL